MLKKYAFFLPQYHEIKENDEWWGKGFTEWVNVKNAKPLYRGHMQPKVPIDGYYNLLEKETVKHQTELMKKYHIDGLIYYHYYFKGDMLLEKPAENLLKWKNIDQNFFFCWANHSWIKSWNGTSEMLKEQLYGNESDWEKHFNYLLPFFKDKRYVKKDNKPLFMIFKPFFDERFEMFNYFNKKCIENGFDGIYIINTYKNNELYKQGLEEANNHYSIMHFFREFDYSISIYRNFYIKVKEKVNKKILKKYLRIYDGNKLINCRLRKLEKGNNIIHGISFEWDNTPRHKERGYIITPINKESFIRYMDSISEEEFVFINAWNEWAEGMILEGTEENGYKYLEWIKEYSESEK